MRPALELDQPQAYSFRRARASKVCRSNRVSFLLRTALLHSEPVIVNANLCFHLDLKCRSGRQASIGLVVRKHENIGNRSKAARPGWRSMRK